MDKLHVRPVVEADRNWVADLLATRWGGREIVTRGRVWDVAALPGFIAEIETEPVGLVTYRLGGDECEVVLLDSRREGVGVGTALLDAVHTAARAAGCRRAWLITTNDNTPALRFYQKRGYQLAALYAGAMETSRRLKPSIPRAGLDGIPIRDEIELEFPLT